MRPLFLPVLVALVAIPVAHAATLIVEVDASQPGAALRDLLGANKKPTASGQTPGTSWSGTALYSAFGISQVRLHDANADLCTTYTAASKLNTGVSPAQAVSGCTLSGTGGKPHFNWTPTSSADADLNNSANYDFTSVDSAVAGTLATGAAVYLRLGESFNGPNDTSDPVAWAKVATNIYRHVIGSFKPTASATATPVFVEVFNEPDGGFWSGDLATFNTLYKETTQRVRAAAAAAGRSVKIGGAGFTRNVLTTSGQAGNPANGFIAAVGASSLDFYSAHHYGSCASHTLAASATFLRSLRTLVNGQGGSGKPLHITEWNIGLGSQCGEDFYAEPRTQSFASGFLTLMQDPAHNVEAAHFYAAMPLMSLFNFTAVAGQVRINPSAWAFWSHARLRGHTGLSAKVCPDGASCVNGYAAETTPLLALAGQADGVQRVVITNDGTSSVSYTLRVKGLGSGAVNATIHQPPASTRDLPAPGNPSTADSAALAALLASVTEDARTGLPVSAGQVELSLSVPARSLQLVEIKSTASSPTARADCLFGWAERQYAQYFAPAGQPSASSAPYYYRYYPGTRNYLATSSVDGDVWVLGPISGGQVQSVGTLASFLATAGC